MDLTPLNTVGHIKVSIYAMRTSTVQKGGRMYDINHALKGKKLDAQFTLLWFSSSNLRYKTSQGLLFSQHRKEH